MVLWLEGSKTPQNLAWGDKKDPVVGSAPKVDTSRHETFTLCMIKIIQEKQNFKSFTERGCCV